VHAARVDFPLNCLLGPFLLRVDDSERSFSSKGRESLPLHSEALQVERREL